MSGWDSRLSTIGERPGGWMAKSDPRERDQNPISIDDLLSFFSFAGLNYPFLSQGTLNQKAELPDPTFEGYVQSMYRGNGVVFACMLRRMLVFSDVRFQWQRVADPSTSGAAAAPNEQALVRALRGAGCEDGLVSVVLGAVRGRPGKLWGSTELSILEKPWRNGTAGDLAARAITDADLGGSFYVRRQGIGAAVAKKLGLKQTEELFRMRPDWVTLVVGSGMAPPPNEPEPTMWDDDAQLLGYLYQPGGPRSAEEAVFYSVEEVAHWAPIPDPTFRFRGMSWLTPILREFLGDRAAETHKLKYFENGATPNLVVTMGNNLSPDKFERWVEKIEKGHKSMLNAYKTLYLGAGSTAQAIGNSLEQVTFKDVQGKGETRIAAASGVPPVLAGLSEGLSSATYSNYSQARHAFGDMTIRPLWRNFCGSLEAILNVPGGSRLWYDDRDIPFLREDGKDLAVIEQTEAATIASLITAGYEPDSVVDAVINHDWTRLIHTGMPSVQLQPGGAPAQPAQPAPAKPPPPNGKKPKAAPAAPAAGAGGA